MGHRSIIPILIVLTALHTVGAVARAQWTEPVRISTDPHLGQPRVAVVGDTLHVTAKTSIKLYYLRSVDNGHTWTDPICPVDTFYRSYMNDIAFTNGRLHIAFIGRAHSQEPVKLYSISSPDHGLTWEEPNEVYYDGWKYPRLAATGDTLFLSSAIPGHILVFSSYDNGGSWAGPFVAEDEASSMDGWPNILYSQGRLHLVYQMGNIRDTVGIEIYYRHSDDHGVTWSDRIYLSTPEGVPNHEHSQGPSAFADSLGNLMALWFDYKYGSECGFTGDILGRVSTDNGDTWLPETRLTYTQTGSTSTCLILDDTLHAIWVDEDLFGCGYRKLMYSLSYDWGRTWAPAAIVYNSDQLYERQPFLFHSIHEESDMIQCIMPAEPSGGPNDLYYVRKTGITDVSEGGSEITPDEIDIVAYPNPFNSTLSLVIQSREDGVLAVYDLLGRVIKEFEYEAGPSDIRWDATDALGNKVSSGIYFARARGAVYDRTIKLVYLR